MITTMTQPVEPRQRALSPLSGGSEASYNERFPSFDQQPRDYEPTIVSESPLEANPGQSVVPEYKWPSRRGTQPFRSSRASGHRPRRSVSDALHKFRNRQGSVSENAHELAEALKAPVSYKLIVRRRRTALSLD